MTTRHDDLMCAIREGSAFTIRAEYNGVNSANLSGQSYKFWSIQRLHMNGPIHICFGKVGSIGAVTCEGITLHDALDRLREKEAKGYRVVDFKVHKRKPSIKSAPPPFNTVRSFRRESDSEGDTWKALDEAGRIIAMIPGKTAMEIESSYDMQV